MCVCTTTVPWILVSGMCVEARYATNSQAHIPIDESQYHCSRCRARTGCGRFDGCAEPAAWSSDLARRVFDTPDIGLFAALYFLCAIGLLLSGASEAQGRWWRILLAGLAAFGAGFMLQAAAIWKWPTFFGDELPVVVPLASSVLGVFLLVALLCIRGAFVWKVLALGSALLGGLVLQYQGSEAPTREVAHVDSSLNVLKATTYRNRVSDDGISGGAIAAFGTGYLLVGGDGQLSLVSENDGGSALDVQQR